MSEHATLASWQALTAPSSAAEVRFHVRADAAAVADAVERIVAGGDHGDLQMDDERQRIRFRARRTIWNWEREIGVTTTPMRRGCDVHIALDVAPNRPSSPHDAEKNAAAVEQLRRQIEAILR
ncbi:hypothetical protein [Microbacterium sp. 179-I 3D4 NHS]|uniref:hypothetical protein n=1 Tax=Microbacterium sp. 179-I 3D4 NHS TaxID=3142381 RepID=UPI0039A3CA80